MYFLYLLRPFIKHWQSNQYFFNQWIKHWLTSHINITLIMQNQFSLTLDLHFLLIYSTLFMVFLFFLASFSCRFPPGSTGLQLKRSFLRPSSKLNLTLRDSQSQMKMSPFSVIYWDNVRKLCLTCWPLFESIKRSVHPSSSSFRCVVSNVFASSTLDKESGGYMSKWIRDCDNDPSLYFSTY